MKLELKGKEWFCSHPERGFRMKFGCAIGVGDGVRRVHSDWAEWREVSRNGERIIWIMDLMGLRHEVEIRVLEDMAALEVWQRVCNPTGHSLYIDSIQSVDGMVEWEGGEGTIRYLHSLNTRHSEINGRAPLCELKRGESSLMLGRVPYSFFEGLALWRDHHLPSVVVGALTQNLTHRTQQVTLTGACQLRLESVQELRGIERKKVEPGQTLKLDGVFVQFRADGEINEIFDDYLTAITKACGTRWEKNPLRTGRFFDPWNNYLYWEQYQKDLISAAEVMKRDFPSIGWIGVDDGYQVTTSNAHLSRLPNGELSYDFPTELDYYNHCPGVSFAFAEGLGEDRKKMPDGLLGLESRFREMGFRSELWLGMEVSRYSPTAINRPELFHPRMNGEHCLLDVSLPEVREKITKVFDAYYGPGKYEAIKLDFYSNLFEEPSLKFACSDRTAAEWRRWFFEMIREHLPEDGFVSLGCNLAAGAPFLSPWVDSYRHSMDMRDGDWENVKNNVRWSLVPSMTHGHQQPIADSDTLSIYKKLSRNELQCWSDFAQITGSVVELGGNPLLWGKKDVSWLRAYLEGGESGTRVWICDHECWQSDGLPVAFCRFNAPGSKSPFLASLHNWKDVPTEIQVGDLSGPIANATQWHNPSINECGKLLAGTTFQIPPRSSLTLEIG